MGRRRTDDRENSPNLGQKSERKVCFPEQASPTSVQQGGRMKTAVRFLSMLAFAAAMTVGWSASPSTPIANAAPGCGANTVCTWSGSNYTSTYREFYPNPTNFCGTTVIPVRSAVNGSTRVIDFWSGPNCTGSHTTVWGGGGASTDLGFSAQSVGWCTSCR